MEPPRPPQRLILAPGHRAAMRAHVAACAPEEACGIVAGRDWRSRAVVPLENTLHSTSRYRIGPEAQFRAFSDLIARELELLAIFHSHPNGPPRPSEVDVAEAFYPNTAYLIWAPSGGDWACRGFRIGDGQAYEIELCVE